MKNLVVHPFLIVLLLLIFTNSCKKDIVYDSNTIINTDGKTGKVKDIEGNVYKIVKIGNQWWMGENLKTTKYRDGTSIPNVTDNTWSSLTTSAYCDYDNTPSNSDIYGRLYNWYAVTNAQNICPKGWHVPSNAEWLELSDYLGNENMAGEKLKQTDTIHWESPNNKATNEVGFTALPGGCRNMYQSYFNYKRQIALWWTSTESSTNSKNAYNREISIMYSYIGAGTYYKVTGSSVRCVKD